MLDFCVAAAVSFFSFMLRLHRLRPLCDSWRWT